MNDSCEFTIEVHELTKKVKAKTESISNAHGNEVH